MTLLDNRNPVTVDTSRYTGAFDLSALALAPPNHRGLQKVLGVRKDAIAAGNAPTPELLQLLPGVHLERGTVLVPCNLTRLPGKRIIEYGAHTPSGLRLRDYQVDGVQFVEDTPRGCIIGDDVGIGKTLEVLEYLHLHPELRPFVVIGPLVASSAWVGPNADPAKHFGMNVLALHTRTPEDIPKDVDGRAVDGVFLNYQILAPWKEKLTNPDGTPQLNPDGTPCVVVHGSWFSSILGLQPRVVVVDECHEVRNFRNTYAKTVHKLCQFDFVAKRIFLSATPVVNRVADLWHQLDSVQPKLWGHWVPYHAKIITSFCTRYASARHNGYGWDCSGESNTGELRARLANVLIRRSRFDVRKELPGFERQRVAVAPASLDQAAYRDYLEIANATREALRVAGGSTLQGHDLRRLTGMFKMLSWSKRNVAVTHAETLARSTETRKLLVFTWFKESASFLVKALKAKKLHVYGPVTGESSISKRNKDAEAFRDLQLEPGGASVFVATLGAAGQSLNPLAAASAVLFVDLYYVPATLLQAEGRVHREGSKAKTVLAQYLTVDSTVDSIMYDHLARKAKQIAGTTGDMTAQSLCEALGGRNEEESLKALVQAMAGLSTAALELT